METPCHLLVCIIYPNLYWYEVLYVLYSVVVGSVCCRAAKFNRIIMFTWSNTNSGSVNFNEDILLEFILHLSCVAFLVYNCASKLNVHMYMILVIITQVNVLCISCGYQTYHCLCSNALPSGVLLPLSTVPPLVLFYTPTHSYTLHTHTHH